MDQILALVYRAVARKKLQPRRTHGPLYEISRMKSSNIISLIKKNKNRQYLVKFYRGECLGSPHTGYGGDFGEEPSRIKRVEWPPGVRSFQENRTERLFAV